MLGPAPKYDEGKRRWDLLPWDIIEEIVKVYEFGVIEYHEESWKAGFKRKRLIAAIFRHFIAWIHGEIRNKDDGNCHHLAQVCWNCITLMYQEKYGTEIPDLREAKNKL